jgi:hypothetical protein
MDIQAMMMEGAEPCCAAFTSCRAVPSTRWTETSVTSISKVDTGSWWPGKTVLIAPEWVTHGIWADAMLALDLKRDTIKNGPEWDPGKPISREFEERLYGYYHRAPTGVSRA